jgi:hypothetical protein
MELSSGFNSVDTLLLGSDIILSSYKAWSILAVCGAGGELGIKAKRSGKNVFMKAFDDTNWNESHEVPARLVPIGEIPTSNDKRIMDSKDTSAYDGFSVANLFYRSNPSTSCGGTLDYSFSRGFNRVFYCVSNS